MKKKVMVNQVTVTKSLVAMERGMNEDKSNSNDDGDQSNSEEGSAYICI